MGNKSGHWPEGENWPTEVPLNRLGRESAIHKNETVVAWCAVPIPSAFEKPKEIPPEPEPQDNWTSQEITARISRMLPPHENLVKDREGV